MKSKYKLTSLFEDSEIFQAIARSQLDKNSISYSWSSCKSTESKKNEVYSSSGSSSTSLESISTELNHIQDEVGK